MHGNFRGLSTGVRFAEFAFGIRGCGAYRGHSNVGIRISNFLLIFFLNTSMEEKSLIRLGINLIV